MVRCTLAVSVVAAISLANIGCTPSGNGQAPPKPISRNDHPGFYVNPPAPDPVPPPPIDRNGEDGENEAADGNGAGERTVYCLDVGLSWEGQPIEGGRLPVYGLEVPNITYAGRHAPKRTRALRLSGKPLLELEKLYLNNNSTSVEFLSRPNLPLKEGTLEVTLSLQACPPREGGWPKELRTLDAEVTRGVRFSEPVPEWEGQSLLMRYKDQHVATLAPESPVRWALTFGAFQGTVAPAVPERAIFIERAPNQRMEISITRPANQTWSFDWIEE
jgi:hypothetical protein